MVDSEAGSVRARLASCSELALINVLSVLAFASTWIASGNVLRAVLGTPLLLLFPGYVLVAALYPSRQKFNAVERLALGFGGSIALVPLISAAWGFSPWGLELKSLLGALVVFIVLCSGIASLRRRRLPAGEQAGFAFGAMALAFVDRLGRWIGNGRQQARLTLLVTAVLLAVGLGLAAWLAKTHMYEERYTEFHILGDGGIVGEYPSELTLGESSSIRISVVNHEGTEAVFRIEAVADEVVIGEAGPVELANGAIWKGQMDFKPLQIGRDQAVEFFMYRDGQVDEDVSPIGLWIDVVE